MFLTNFTQYMVIERGPGSFATDIFVMKGQHLVINIAKVVNMQATFQKESLISVSFHILLACNYTYRLMQRLMQR